MILMIDNYDSFTYNLVQYLGELGEDLVVRRNDEVTVADIETMKPDFVMISPGPCTPNEAGISLETVGKLSGRIPLFGVCLGQQSIAQSFGGDVVRAERLMHGKTSPVFHDGKTIFKGVPNPFRATRYHSLIVKKETLPDCFEVSESIMTEHGKEMLQNFIDTYRGVPCTRT
jgi:para-aminobenzoate synthetase component 2